MAKIQKRRVEDQLRRVLTELVTMELSDPRLGMASVTRVELTDDLAYGRVYVSSVGDEDEVRRNLQVIRRAAGWLRREVAGRMRLKRAPELTYHMDETLSAEARITELLREADDEEANDR
jgi:ribosome-binding factor A